MRDGGKYGSSLQDRPASCEVKVVKIWPQRLLTVGPGSQVDEPRPAAPPSCTPPCRLPMMRFFGSKGSTANEGSPIMSWSSTARTGQLKALLVLKSMPLGA